MVPNDIQTFEDQPTTTQTVTPHPQLPTHKCISINPEMAKLAFSFGQYLNTLPGAKAYASTACKVLYQQILDAQENFETLWKAKGTDFKVPTSIYVWRITWWNLYILNLDKDMFATLVSEN